MDTNSGNPTYYFRGNVTNNYVLFAGLTWRIIRINEDGTVRLILNSRINRNTYTFSRYSGYTYMYYSNESNAKSIVDSWYKTNITNKGYDSYVSPGVFCEQSKVKKDSRWTSGNATMDVYSSYTPNFKCLTDANEKGKLDIKVGLITYDEVIHAGGYYDVPNRNYYLYDGFSLWTMSPAGVGSSWTSNWVVNSYGELKDCSIDYGYAYFRPVINLNANVSATGTGTSSDPYVIQTN